MRGLTGSTQERLLRRHSVQVRRVCALALGDTPEADGAAADAISLAASATGLTTRPGDRLPRLLALAVFACDSRAAGPAGEGDGDPGRRSATSRPPSAPPCCCTRARA